MINIKSLIAIHSVYESIENIAMPVKTAYKFKKLEREVSDGLKFYTDRLNQIIETYGMKDENGKYIISEDGNSIEVAPEKISECNERLAELNNFEITKPDISFSLEELDGLNLTFSQIDILFPFITE